MKYVWKIAFAFMLGMLVALPGCGVAPEERLADDDPINGNPDLDPDDPENIVAFFYTDRPVSGLIVACRKAAAFPILTETDGDGSFVCPRDRRATFYVGEPTSERFLELGHVDLEIYGRLAPVDDPENREADARERVTITPSTLVGTTADSSHDRVANMFQLLYMLDSSGGSELQDRIVLNGAVHEAFSIFVDPAVDLSKDSDIFGLTYDNDILAMDGYQETDTSTPTTVHLRNRQPDDSLALDSGPLLALVDRSLRAARAGLYGYVPFPLDDNDDNTQTLVASAGILVGRNGQTSGMGFYWIVDHPSGSASTNSVEIMTLDSGAQIAPNGRFEAVSFHTADNDDFTIQGRLVNDRLYGAVADLDTTQNYKIPDTYPLSSLDVGEFLAGSGDFKAQMTMYRSVESLPDVDHDHLNGFPLPRDYGVLYKAYPDGLMVTDAQRNDPAYLTSQSAKQLRFRILANGDIVSDADEDCEDVADDNGTYKDEGGQVEAVIGQVGPVFEVGEAPQAKSYITMSLAVYDQTQSAFGYQLGLPPLDGPTLDPVVIDVSATPVRLLNKRCDPEAASCSEPIEWFDTNVYYSDSFAPFVVATGNIPNQATAQAYFRKDNYYGQVTGFVELCTGP